MATLKRNLYRVSYIIDERALHDTLLKLTAAHAMNVEVAPVTPPPEHAEPAAEQPDISQLNGSSARATILAAARDAHGGRINTSNLIEAHPQISKGSVHQALSNLTTEKILRRVAPGTYVARKVALKKAIATIEAKPPRHLNTKGKAYTRTPGSTKFVLELLQGGPLTRAQIAEGFVKAGRPNSLAAVDGAIRRAKSKTKRVGDTIQLRG
jgi:hypothetical protein